MDVEYHIFRGKELNAMARGIPAIVTPEVLQWARDLDRITIDEIAQKLNVDAAKVSAWENGNEHPSLTQAKKLAKQYRVPFAFFYLPDVPKRAKRLEKTDYRTFGNWGFPEMNITLLDFPCQIFRCSFQQRVHIAPFLLDQSAHSPDRQRLTGLIPGQESCHITPFPFV